MAEFQACSKKLAQGELSFARRNVNAMAALGQNQPFAGTYRLSLLLKRVDGRDKPGHDVHEAMIFFGGCRTP
jgi:hypothetical protein